VSSQQAWGNHGHRLCRSTDPPACPSSPPACSALGTVSRGRCRTKPFLAIHPLSRYFSISFKRCILWFSFHSSLAWTLPPSPYQHLWRPRSPSLSSVLPWWFLPLPNSLNHKSTLPRNLVEMVILPTKKPGITFGCKPRRASLSVFCPMSDNILCG
jgi:hypothetical protein